MVLCRKMEKSMPAQRKMKMPKLRVWIALVVAGTGCAGAWAQPEGGARLNAGPAYTSKDGQNGPRFPRIDVVVRLRRKAK